MAPTVIAAFSVSTMLDAIGTPDSFRLRLDNRPARVITTVMLSAAAVEFNPT